MSEAVIRHSQALIRHRYGNYVVKALYAHGSPTDRCTRCRAGHRAELRPARLPGPGACPCFPTLSFGPPFACRAAIVAGVAPHAAELSLNKFASFFVDTLLEAGSPEESEAVAR